MKNLILSILLLGIINPVWSEDKEKLVAKCTYGPNDTIAPGDVFVYILKIDEKFFTINGIANQSDDLRQKNLQPLRGELPLLEILSKSHQFYWILPNLIGASKASDLFLKEKATVPISLRLKHEPVEGWLLTEDGDKFTMRIGVGVHPFTSSVYPVCSLWKWWED